MILLDTSVVLEIVERRSGYLQCAEQLQRFGPDDVHVSAITVFEIERGLFDGSPNIRRRRASWRQFQDLTIRELVTDDIASVAAEIVRSTSKTGMKLGNMDALIAGTAMVMELTLATRDRDFARVAGLQVELWR